MASFKIDDIDRKILFFLINDARKPYLEIARECGVSGAAIHQRIRKLEENGIITGSRLLIKPSALGLNVCAFISIVVSDASKSQEVLAALKKIPEVVECHFVTGKYTLLVKIYCRDNDHLMEVILHSLREVPFIQSTDTMISLGEVLERQVWVKESKPKGRSPKALKK